MVYFTLLLLSFAAIGAENYLVHSSDLAMKIPYSLGEHKAKTDKISGSIHWDPETKTVYEAEFSLRAENLVIKDPKLKCHLLESLTLDYEKSDFPADHVCDDDKLPVSGKNSPAYPVISARLLSPLKPGEAARLEWTMHGQSQEQTVPLEITHDENTKQITVKAKWKLRRSDFGIIVKKFLVIDADDTLPFELTMTLEKK